MYNKKHITDKLISKYWNIKTGEEQIYGSPSDVYGEINYNGIKYWLRIDDGNSYNILNDALYHIYVNNTDGKIFEGRISSQHDFKIVMKVLGFKPKNIN